ncbi:hypothetical protein, partial [Streptomyces chartreusis]|uniref:hypothetical protein n=1 Tax=Streptomyces chartreusis TaxID=1969 RepID=UPI003AF0CDC7
MVGHVEGAVEVLGEDVAGQAVLGVVGAGYGLVLVGEALDDGDRSEDLGAGEVGVGRYVVILAANAPSTARSRSASSKTS